MRRPVVPSWPSTKTRVAMAGLDQWERQHKAERPALRERRRPRPGRRSPTMAPWRPRNRRGSGSAWRRCSARASSTASRRAAGDGEPHSLPLDQPAGRPLPAAHAHGRRRALRAGRKHQGAGRDAAGAGAAAAPDRRRRPRRATRSSPASGAFALPDSPGSTRCRCSCATSSDEAAAAMALIENIQREDLNPLEEARGLNRLTEEFGMTHEAAARAVGRSRSAATNLLRLLNLSEPVQQMLLAGDLEMGHARALLALDGARQIIEANEIVARKPERARSREAVGAPGRGQRRSSAPAARAKGQKGRDIAAPRTTTVRRARRAGRGAREEAHGQRARPARSRSRSPRSTSSTACLRGSVRPQS